MAARASVWGQTQHGAGQWTIASMLCPFRRFGAESALPDPAAMRCPSGRMDARCLHGSAEGGACMLKDVGPIQYARCVALTQEHRGHGISTAAYYLGRELVAQGLRVLLVDLTGRRARLSSLVSR